VKFQVRITARAEQDVESVLHWFRDQSASAAARDWLDELLARIDTLETRPERCSLAAESEELEIDLRELLFGRRHGIYRILFVVDGRTVNILHIRHGARDSVTLDDLG
jgi:plasmid stabilization system protein ParE